VAGAGVPPGSARSSAHVPVRDPRPSHPSALPDGFRVKSLAEDKRPGQGGSLPVARLQSPGEPPAMAPQTAGRCSRSPFPQGPGHGGRGSCGAFVAYAGLWFDATTDTATWSRWPPDPDYRRRGLGTAAVLEGIRRCGELGATVAYVGNDLPIYLAMGFRKLFTLNCWSKRFPAG